MVVNYTQGTNIEEIVIPLMIGEANRPTDSEKNLLIKPPRELIGTGFLIGPNGYLLTAAHVIDQLNELRQSNEDILFTHLRDKDGFHPFIIKQQEKHPTDDVGIMKLSVNLNSLLRISNRKYLHSTPYTAWGYPRENADELKFLREDGQLLPQIIYTEGYIRRVIHTELRSSMFIGKRFYEVSDLGGSGYSGAPVLAKSSIGKGAWDVIGIYIGEKEGQGAQAGYVVPSVNFADWIPEILGHSILEESIKGSLNIPS